MPVAGETLTFKVTELKRSTKKVTLSHTKTYAEAKAAQAAAEGNYKAAAAQLEGYNAAIAAYMNNDLAAAKKAIAKDASADADYLRAVIAAKEGDVATAKTQLKSAVAKAPKLAEKAAKDVLLKNIQ